MPILYILAGYYLAGRLFVAPSEALERLLLAWDRRLFGDPTTRFAAGPDGWLRISIPSTSSVSAAARACSR